MKRRRRLTDDELIWRAYCRAPEQSRLCADIDSMPESARRIWLDIAKRNIAGGWNPDEEPPA